jgi:Mitochondrial carrier protein
MLRRPAPPRSHLLELSNMLAPAQVHRFCHGVRVSAGLHAHYHLDLQHSQARLGLWPRLVIAFQMSTRQHGMAGLYAGMAPNALQVLPSSALSYFTYETMKVVLDVRD